ncbi:branched-chain amino acid ABC transporter permease [Zafaria sp. Z1313]|uniref:branched-chain amino acid ABC transporter permease n=1 Tax=unclassified Zafaria TaxID=2828765 RepID=UPI002E790F9D|nr:branched-chain amino acid ABC transporter permease [Zafaria sp. J156]MEE1619918.1 branched-chain amino acid ABC transporter permease [Zafaria sp. J156]
MLAMLASLLALAPAANALPAAASVPAAATQASTQELAIRGTIRHAQEPLQGVRITATGDGFTGESITDENGRWEIIVPVKAQYTVELDTSTLPEEAPLAEGQQNPRTVTFGNTSNVGVIFQVGEVAAGGGATFLDTLAERALAGLSFGLLLALAAVGLSLIFGTTGLTNFAHGEMVTFGAVAAFGLAATGMPVWLALGIAVLLGGALGYAQDWGLWRPLRRRGSALVPMMIVSIGLALAMRYVIQFFFGGSTRQLPGAQSPVIEFGTVAITRNNLTSLIISAVVITLLGILLLKTRFGKATRAVADNPALASASGIDVDAVIRMVWVAGGMLAALGGILWAYYRPGASFNMGQQILLLIFAGVTLGGLGTVFGALVGSILVGLMVEISTIWLEADLKYVGALFVMIAVLLFRPQGILGRKERVG